MANLPAEQRTQNLIAIYNPKKGQSVADTRRLMAELPEVTKALHPVDKHIFFASTKTQLKDMPGVEVAEELKTLFRYIAIDVGYKIPDNKREWQYTETRLFDVLMRYFSQLTLADIKLAFELLAVGELNDYLPKDANKQPDGKHYQHFNAEYFSKILNAYIARQNEVIAMAYDALPGEPEQPRNTNNEFAKRKCREIYYQYKYRGKFDESDIGLPFVYVWLVAIGYADEVVPTSQDRHKAFMCYRGRLIKGLENKVRGAYILKKGEGAEELDYEAHCIARNKEIKRAFDEMLKVN